MQAEGCLTVLGGPELANYVPEYLNHSADVVVVGEGELAMEELLPRLLREGTDRLEDVPGPIGVSSQNIRSEFSPCKTSLNK